VKEVNYIEDFLSDNPEVDHSSLDLRVVKNGHKTSYIGGDRYESAVGCIEKKMLKDGYNESSTRIAKILKNKSADEGYYDLTDPFIDESAILEKKKPIVEFDNFEVITSSLESFYNSTFYQKKIEEVTMIEIKRESMNSDEILKEGRKARKF